MPGPASRYRAATGGPLACHAAARLGRSEDYASSPSPRAWRLTLATKDAVCGVGTPHVFFGASPSRRPGSRVARPARPGAAQPPKRLPSLRPPPLRGSRSAPTDRAGRPRFGCGLWPRRLRGAARPGRWLPLTPLRGCGLRSGRQRQKRQLCSKLLNVPDFAGWSRRFWPPAARKGGYRRPPFLTFPFTPPLCVWRRRAGPGVHLTRKIASGGLLDSPA